MIDTHNHGVFVNAYNGEFNSIGIIEVQILV